MCDLNHICDEYEFGHTLLCHLTHLKMGNTAVVAIFAGIQLDNNGININELFGLIKSHSAPICFIKRYNVY